MFVGVKILAFNVLLLTKSEQQVIGNWFCAPINFKKQFFNYKYAFTICVGCLIRKRGL